MDQRKTLKVLITGASGIVGRYLGQYLKDQGLDVLGLVRTPRPLSFQYIQADDLLDADWDTILDGMDAVVHLAARVHVMKETSDDPYQENYKTNVEATLKLAQAAVNKGIEKFIFMSTIKVNGEGKELPYECDDQADPSGPYAQTKYIAEEKLKEVFSKSPEKLVILRPTLMYGPGVKGNMLSLMKMANKGIPLPLKNLRNKRHFLSLGNLSNAIYKILICDPLPSQVYLVSDGVDHSTAELYQQIANGFKKGNLLFGFPLVLLKKGLAALGKSSVYQRLAGNLQVNTELLLNDLKWYPPYSFQEGIQEMIEDFNDQQVNRNIIRMLLERLAALLMFLFLLPIYLLVALAIKVTSPGPILHWSKRIGVNNEVFLMPKFRTMRIGTPQLATHLMKNQPNPLTAIGSFLRKSSLDEIPQLISIIKGDMTFIGPRPALYNQYDLIELRTNNRVHKLLPGITGWAQINGRDESSIPDKVEKDTYYYKHRTLALDFKILMLTFYKVFFRKDISH